MVRVIWLGLGSSFPNQYAKCHDGPSRRNNSALLTKKGHGTQISLISLTKDKRLGLQSYNFLELVLHNALG